MTEPAAVSSINPAIEAAIRGSFGQQGLMWTLGAKLVTIALGRVVIEMPRSNGSSQQQGLFHGGAIGAVGDSAGGYAALSLMPVGSEVVTVEYKINFVRPAKGALLRAEGLVVRAGKSVTVARVDIAAIDGSQTTVVALLQATFMRVAGVV